MVGVDDNAVSVDGGDLSGCMLVLGLDTILRVGGSVRARAV
jgi:hypothetical protein